MSDDQLIRNCSPTLAGIKTGNLFRCEAASQESLNEDIRAANRRLVPKGIRVLPLICSQSHALVYVYRPSRLKKDLSDVCANRILNRAHYPAAGPEQCIAELMRRLRNNPEFPHEIGLFLGYPPADVEGFIANKAGNYKCVGCWKVYGDEQAAKKKFEAYSRCTKCYCERRHQGASLDGRAIRTRADEDTSAAAFSE